jgi:hypothetical protein
MCETQKKMQGRDTHVRANRRNRAVRLGCANTLPGLVDAIDPHVLERRMRADARSGEEERCESSKTEHPGTIKGGVSLSRPA